MTTEYPLLDEMKQLKLPPTRENYFALDTWEYRRSHGIVDPMSTGNLKVRYHQNFGDKFFKVSGLLLWQDAAPRKP